MIQSPATTAETIRFLVNGHPVDVPRKPGGRRLLDVLRVELGLTGAKEGCGEGECGACSVVLDGAIVDSCLVPVGHVDGHAILTVEGLATDGRLSALQESFLERGGTQCGMCTPGLLMAAHAHLASGRPAGDADIREAIAGNLCRCTGYTKVVEAIEAAGSSERPPYTRALGDAPSTDVAPPAVVQTRGHTPSGPRLVRPSSLPDALARLAADPDLRPFAGGTDVMVELAMGSASPERPLLDLWELDELRGHRGGPGRARARRDDHLGGAAPVPGRAARAARAR